MRRRFEIGYSRANRILLALTGLGPKRSGVELDPGSLRVWMGWAWNVTIPRSSIRKAEPGGTYRFTAGVHGWRGRWLVNGCGTRIVRLRIDPPVRTRSVFIPIELAELEVSLDDPEAFLEALHV